MAIPVYLQQFKAAGIYRVVFDKSTVLGVDAEILRLVVGYSENGPFNIPTYVTSVSDFKALYGDISKKLERRGVYFHRLAIQALASGPILCLNLKKFSTETVDGASISTNFNPSFEPIDTVKLNVEDIYDTTRFWELSAEKLNGLKSAEGEEMDQYINICATSTASQSATYFIRKASGNSLNSYKISVSDWYSDDTSAMPDYLENYKNSLISDFFAEIYVFKGKFNASQVLASTTLKNYFAIKTDEDGNVEKDDDDQPILQLRPYVTNAYGEAVDTLDALYNDGTSGALGHYIGSLIPEFKTKQGVYVALDILFNSDQDTHSLMMSFNTDLLDEGAQCIDLSGRLAIPDAYTLHSNVEHDLTDKSAGKNGLSLAELFDGTAKTTLLGNQNSKVVVDKPIYINNIVNVEYDADGNITSVAPKVALNASSARKINGTLYVTEVVADASMTEGFSIVLQQVGQHDENDGTISLTFDDRKATFVAAYTLGAAKKYTGSTVTSLTLPDDENKYYISDDKSLAYVINDDGVGTLFAKTTAFIDEDNKFTLEGPEKVITSIARLEQSDRNSGVWQDADANMKVVTVTVTCQEQAILSSDENVYSSSVSFLPIMEGWVCDGDDSDLSSDNGLFAMYSDVIYDNSLLTSLSKGDCLLADDGSTDFDADGEVDELDGFFDNVYVQEVKTIYDDNGDFKAYQVILSGQPLICTGKDQQQYLVRIDNPINQEIGTMVPQYLEGYTYQNPKPAGTTMYDKLEWQKFILSALTEYKGLRTGLLNKSDIDYRYIVDTFETYVDEEAKSVLSYLAKEKQSAFAILNFPSVKTFIKCPYAGFTNTKGVFDVQYIVDGGNKKKPASVRFSLPSDADGASFCAFYTPLKFSDGYVDTIVPAAGLVSNLFMEKYTSRQPYYIIAGPNYGRITASGLVGPDYKYSQDDLNIIEPYGVNCMIYRPGFGTFINANQTAKQTPVSALSKVNVRELVIYLQDEIEKVLQAYQWEFNNANTRNAILDKANSICARVAANGGLQAYLNVMDESNNTAEIIDNEMAILSTHIEPGMGCGKMVQELTIYRTGQMASSISE